MTSKNGICQVVKAATACLAQISLSMHLCVVEPLFNYLLKITSGTVHFLRPPDGTNGFIAFCFINQGLNIDQHPGALTLTRSQPLRSQYCKL